MKKVGHKLTACMWEGWSLVGAVAGWSCLVPGCCCFSLLLPCLLPHVGVSLSGSCLRCLLCLSGLLLLSGALVCNWANSGTRGRVGKLRKKRKRHVSYRLLKKEITNWTIRSSKTARVCFSCRFVGARRFKRNFRERKRLKPFCWWMPHFYKYRGYPLKCLSPKLFGKGFFIQRCSWTVQRFEPSIPCGSERWCW